MQGRAPIPPAPSFNNNRHARRRRKAREREAESAPGVSPADLPVLLPLAGPGTPRGAAVGTTRSTAHANAGSNHHAVVLPRTSPARGAVAAGLRLQPQLPAFAATLLSAELARADSRAVSDQVQDLERRFLAAEGRKRRTEPRDVSPRRVRASTVPLKPEDTIAPAPVDGGVPQHCAPAQYAAASETGPTTLDPAPAESKGPFARTSTGAPAVQGSVAEEPPPLAHPLAPQPEDGCGLAGCAKAAERPSIDQQPDLAPNARVDGPCGGSQLKTASAAEDLATGPATGPGESRPAAVSAPPGAVATFFPGCGEEDARLLPAVRGSLQQALSDPVWLAQRLTYLNAQPTASGAAPPAGAAVAVHHAWGAPAGADTAAERLEAQRGRVSELQFALLECAGPLGRSVEPAGAPLQRDAGPEPGPALADPTPGAAHIAEQLARNDKEIVRLKQAIASHAAREHQHSHGTAARYVHALPAVPLPPPSSPAVVWPAPRPQRPAPLPPPPYPPPPLPPPAGSPPGHPAARRHGSVYLSRDAPAGPARRRPTAAPPLAPPLSAAVKPPGSIRIPRLHWPAAAQSEPAVAAGSSAVVLDFSAAAAACARGPPGAGCLLQPRVAADGTLDAPLPGLPPWAAPQP